MNGKQKETVKIVRFDEDTVEALQALASELRFYRLVFLRAMERLEEKIDEMTGVSRRIMVEEEIAPERETEYVPLYFHPEGPRGSFVEPRGEHDNT